MLRPRAADVRFTTGNSFLVARLAHFQRWPAAAEQKSSSASAHLGARFLHLRDSRVVIVVLVKGPSSFQPEAVFRVSSAQANDSEL